MSFDAITLKILLLETQSRITGRTIDRVMEHRDGEFAFILRNESGPSILFISINPNFPAFFHSETHKINFLNNFSNYQALLKKHLEGARIIGLKQVYSDRILAVRLLRKDSFSEKGYTLFFEFMGRHSNSFLYESFDEPGSLNGQKVVGAVNFSHGLCDFINGPSRADIAKAVRSNATAANASVGETACLRDLIKTYSGLSPFLCLAAEAAGAGAKDAADDIAAVYSAANLDELKRLVKAGGVKHNSIFKIYNTAIYSRSAAGAKKSFVYPFNLSGADAAVGTQAVCDTLNECWIRFFMLQDSERVTAGLRGRIEKLRAAAEKKKAAFAADLESSRCHSTYSNYGSLLIASMNDIKLRGDNDRRLETIDAGGEKVPLDPRFTVSENAQRYFKLARRLRARNDRCAKALSEIDSVLARITECFAALDSPGAVFSADFCPAIEKSVILIASELINDGRARKKFLGEFGGELKKFRSCVAARSGPGAADKKDKAGVTGNTPSVAGDGRHYRRFESEDGFAIFVGRSDAGNDFILSKIADQQDYWLHAKDFRGSSVILKTPKNADPEAVERAIAEAALYAAHYSQGRNATRIFVSCALRKHVKKVKRVAGKVTYSNEKSILVDIARLEEKFGPPGG